jgi:Tfp pilus assembly protein PilF
LCFKECLQRWQLETQSILLSSLAYLMVIVFFRWWDGSISYGPRYMLSPIVLLMPLTIPAFERAVCRRSIPWEFATWTTLVLGSLVQFIGVSVYVVVNEWYQDQHNMSENGAFVFVPSASPIWVQLRELLSGSNITMWSFRAISARSTPLILFFTSLVVISIFAYRQATRPSDAGASRIPEGVTVAVAAMVLIGFALTTSISTSIDMRVLDLLNAGLVAQRAGLAVKAEELYAIVLGLDRSNKYALQNMATLYEEAGRTPEAISLYKRALATDPAFTPALHDLERYQVTRATSAVDACQTAMDCYSTGQDLVAAGNVEGALHVWESASRRFPDQAWLIRDVAWCRYRLGDKDGAVSDYRRAAELSPGDDGILTDLAWSLVAAGRVDEAKGICREVLARDSGNVAAEAILGQLGVPFGVAPPEKK